MITGTKTCNLRLAALFYFAAIVTISTGIAQPVPVNLRSLHLSADQALYSSGTFRWQMLPGCDFWNMQLGFVNLTKLGFFLGTNHMSPITIKASVEINGFVTPVFFSGIRHQTVNPGEVVFSDVVPVHVKSIDMVFLRTFVDSGTNGFPASQTLYGAIGQNGNDAYTRGIDTVDQTDLAGYTIAFTQTAGYGPSAILGIPDRLVLTGAIVGDSIASGANDQACGSNRWSQPIGFLERAFKQSGIPSTSISMGGDTVSNFVATTNWRIPLLRGVKIAVCNYPINDMQSAYNESIDYIKQCLLDTWSTLFVQGCTLYQTTILPQTYQINESDFWLSLTNQAPLGWENKRLAVNAWLRSASHTGAVAQAKGTLHGIFDTAAFVEVNGRWQVPSSVRYTGVCSSITTNSLTDTNCAFVPGELRNNAVLRIDGQMYIITQNTETNFTVAGWQFPVAAKSKFEIWTPPTMDGTHPTRTAHAALSKLITIPYLVVSQQDESLLVSWPSCPGAILETRTNLGSPWIPFSGYTTTTNAVVPVDYQARFFRIWK